MTANGVGIEAATLMAALITSQGADGGSAHRSVRIVRDAHRFMESNLDQRCSVPAVAAEVGVSRRSLENAFRRCTGVSPARFWRTLRLNNMRRLLETGRYRVTEAAHASGLTHLGRMSADYRDLFDELPSVTAERSWVA